MRGSRGRRAQRVGATVVRDCDCQWRGRGGGRGRRLSTRCNGKKFVRLGGTEGLDGLCRESFE
jgi:hypothetical protein